MAQQTQQRPLAEVILIRGRRNASEVRRSGRDRKPGPSLVKPEGPVTLAMAIYATGLSRMLVHALASESIHIVGDLVLFSESDLRRVPNIGKQSIVHIGEMLAKAGLRLADKSIEETPGLRWNLPSMRQRDQ